MASEEEKAARRAAIRIEKVTTLRKKYPKLFKKIRAGDITVDQAIRQLNRNRRLAKLKPLSFSSKKIEGDKKGGDQ